MKAVAKVALFLETPKVLARNFKKKWFAPDTVSDRRKYYIDEVLAEAKQELYDTFDIENNENERKDIT